MTTDEILQKARERERELDLFVQREVHANVTMLIARLIELGDEDYPFDAHDWREAAEQAGWTTTDFGTITRYTEAHGEQEVDTWQEACEACEPPIEPVEREIFTYWIVSGTLADELEAEGETVCDYHGQKIWGRTTYGQCISIDRCIRRIYDRLFKQTGGEL